MRKAIGEATGPAKEPSGRRYWVRAATPGSPLPIGECADALLAVSDLDRDELGRSGSGSERAAGRSKKARFLEPYRLSDERRGELVELLGIAGVGDREGRELFAAAVEYDIAEYRQAAGSTPAERATEPVPAPPSESAPIEETAGSAPLARLAEAARDLATFLAALGVAERAALGAALAAGDRFRRDYGGGYLDAMGDELRRLADAAESCPSASPVVGEARTLASESPGASQARSVGEPPMGEAARRFVRRIGRVFEECLDARVSVEPHSPFLAVLGLVAPEAGIPLPRDPADLTGVLAEP